MSTPTSRYSPQQLYEVVSNVDDYKKFLPWCSDSRVLVSRPPSAPLGGRKVMQAELVVGFQAFNERYTSEVTCDNPTQVRAVASNSLLFNHLENRWRFTPIPNPHQVPGSPPKQPLCQVDFYVNFEFSSPIHAQISNLFFDQVSSLMIKAFVDRCHQLYGPPSPVPRSLQGK
ncbi:cyclase/dehydrase [Basidiobolus meristosporus CBS 931.73]|uniref:Cyclase/dehydrase n=1 Tax=Basidiobolus meristosporus CBS 931.73 TaxID=1314790 RepID=A0A1Y1Y681_9FUNG|nr:cyclase/dehydrase [Basidiobolus meristosporus CBS 931.73]|eukprot:ORX93094.1 cyclase/dehydrase [Basidiobolus meristosporus CBS 931.73]